jgi:methionyl-tRNA formyltransferase
MSSSERIAFLGSPDFAVVTLQALVDSGANVVGVVTQPDRPAGRGKQLRPPAVKVFAESVGINVWQPARIRGGNLRRWFEDQQIDLAVVAAFGRILTKPMLAAPRLGCVNLHASLLPRWRGAAPIQRAIVAGDRESGVCLMQMDVGLDTGPVLARSVVPITDTDTAGTLHDKLAAAGAQLIMDKLADLFAGHLVAAPQPDDGIMHAAMLSKEEGRVDWHADASAVHCLVRGMSPWPGTWTVGPDGQRWKVHADGVSTTAMSGPAGQILAIGDEEVVFGCGQGALRVVCLQRPGKRRGPAAAVIRGARLEPGAIFGATS